VIAEQFFGHTHYDEFALFYSSATKNAASAVSTAWIGPSVTPYTNLNPGFRIYKVDTGNWNIYDSETYVADLSQAPLWDSQGTTPNWHLEYSARTAYSPFAPIAASEPLSSAWWHNVTAAFESNDAAFQKYWTYRGKSANKIPACASGSACPQEMICDLRAGKSSDACSPISFALKARSDLRAEAMMDPSGLHTLYKRAPLKPWNKKLCGTIDKH
jgi:sphingomyelin phosphodiesterase